MLVSWLLSLVSKLTKGLGRQSASYAVECDGACPDRDGGCMVPSHFFRDNDDYFLMVNERLYLVKTGYLAI